MSKPEMKRLGIPSPNLADAVMMTMDGGTPAYEPVELEQIGWGGARV